MRKRRRGGRGEGWGKEMRTQMQIASLFRSPEETQEEGGSEQEKNTEKGRENDKEDEEKEERMEREEIEVERNEKS